MSATPLTLLKLCVLETSHSLACTFYEFVKVCRCFYATNENIHMLSMKFPHLFLRPEITNTFLWGWEWSGGGGGGRCDTALRGILVTYMVLNNRCKTYFACSEEISCVYCVSPDPRDSYCFVSFATLKCVM